MSDIVIINQSPTQVIYLVGPAGSVSSTWTGAVPPGARVPVPVTGYSSYCVALSGDHGSPTNPGYLVLDDQPAGATVTLALLVDAQASSSPAEGNIAIVNDTPTAIYYSLGSPGESVAMLSSNVVASQARVEVPATLDGAPMPAKVQLVGSVDWVSGEGQGAGTIDIDGVWAGSTLTLSLTTGS